MADSTRSQTQIIKESVAKRAKYAKGSFVIFPWHVVPHPKNRGGQPCKSLRTKDLVGKLVSEGFDPIEANSNGVVVEQLPAVAGDTEDQSNFQKIFEDKHKSDPDIALSREGHKAKYASLSHGHLNVGLRNLVALP